MSSQSVRPKGTFYSRDNVHWVRLPDNRLKIISSAGAVVQALGIQWRDWSRYTNQEVISQLQCYSTRLDEGGSGPSSLTFRRINTSSEEEKKSHRVSSSFSPRADSSQSFSSSRFSSSSNFVNPSSINQTFSSSSSSSSSQPHFHKRNKTQKPVLTHCAEIYKNLKHDHEKQALLSYLLQYQHYNADFSPKEMDLLSYPYPICNMQSNPRYVRTSPHLYHLVSPFVNKYLTPFFGEAPNPYVNLNSSLVLDVLSLFCPNYKPELIHLEIKDLKKGPLKVLNEKKAGNGPFLFYLKDPNLDCTLIWEGVIDSKGQLNWKKLDPEIISILGKAGATADRLAANQFRAQDQKELLESLQLEWGSEKSKKRNAFVWHEKMEEMNKFALDENAGIYRDAILQWHSCYLEKFPVDFVLPLLESEVLPWISDSTDLARWAKAYQNLSEIILFSLAANPQISKEFNFEKTYLSLLDPKNKLQNLQCHSGLFPYAMSATSFVLGHLLKQKKFPLIFSVSQSYFETLDLLGKARGIRFDQKMCLDDIQTLPDILFVDIHPNNAAKSNLFQNDVGNWVSKMLKDNPKSSLSLVLDLTLNHLSDPVVQKTIEQLRPFIVKGQLELFILQSFAKLIQFGADNFSGGACIYIGDKNRNSPQFPDHMPEKGAFFSILCSDFRELNQSYFDSLRKKTLTMFQNLQKKIREIDECPGSLVFNADEETVYVALNFSDLYKVVSTKSFPLDQLKNLFLEIAHMKNLRITGRQSFGFPFSNMTVAADSIRFSVGLEDSIELEKQAELIEDILQMLSIALSEEKKNLTFDLFRGQVLDALDIMRGEKDFLQENQNSKTNGDQEKKPRIGFENSEPFIRVEEEGKTVDYEGDIVDGSTIVNHEWTPSEKLRLSMYLLNSSKVPYVGFEPECEKHFGIGGIVRESSIVNLLDLENRNDSDEKEGENSTHHPFLKKFCNRNDLTLNNTFVILENAGTVPVRLGHLTENQRLHEFSRIMTHALQIEPHPDTNHPHSYVIKLGERIPFLNYEREIREAYKKNHLVGLMEFLNQLDPEKMPLPHDYSYSDFLSYLPKDRLTKPLRQIGCEITYQMNKEYARVFNSIKNKKYRSEILNGTREKLLKGKLLPLTDTPYKVLRTVIENISFEDPDELQSCIKHVHDQLFSHQNEMEQYYRHALFLLPHIKKEFDRGSSLINNPHTALRLKAIGAWLEPYDKTLQNHILELENDLLKKDIQYISGWLKLATTYPFSSENHQTLMKKLSELSSFKLLKWLDNPNLLYAPLDREIIDEISEYGNPEEYDYFNQNDQKLLKEFFSSTALNKMIIDRLNSQSVPEDNLISVLKDTQWKLAENEDLQEKIIDYVNPDLNKYFSQAIYWGIITQDDSIFSAVIENWKSVTDHEGLKNFISHLDPRNEKQNKLINLLKKIDQE